MNRMRSSFFTALWTAAISAIAIPGHGVAQEKVMVVFDASGSMWGQIDGVSKIDIAKNTLKRTIRDWKGLDLQAGLIVYGHRRKGDCEDIELKIPSGPINTRSFSSTVNKIKPRGKTPLTAAVRQAAESLKYTEEKATVILLSDGKETCDLDPCAVATELENNGVDFTTHVIGFDVAKREEKRQLQCLAENTGGVFVSAKNANELVVAFQRVVEPQRPFAIQASNKADGRPVPGPVNWSVSGGDVNIAKTTETARLEVSDLPDGQYDVSATAGAFKGQGTFDIGKDRPGSVELEMVAELPMASIDAPDSVPAAEEFAVSWQGPGAKGDKVQLARPGSVPGSSFIQSLDVGKGATLTFRAPGKQGRYELRYYSASLKKLLAQRPITVGKPKPSAFLTAVDEIAAGATFEVQWEGPGHKRDWVGLATPKMKAGKHKTYAYTKSGNPVSLRAPAKPGDYELRYVNGTETKVMGRRKLKVVPAEMELIAVDRVKGGASFEVKWKGPGHKSDWVGLATPKMKPGRHKSYAYVRQGNPLTLRAPTAPGQYEIRYVHAGETAIMARRKLVVEPSGAALTAPEEVKGGQAFEVKWEGPGHKRDWVGIASPKDKPGKHKSYAYTRQGNPAKLRAPTAPGEYEIRYVNASETTIMASRKLVVKEGGVTLDAVGEIGAGEPFDVQWVGPGQDNDWIGIADVKAKASNHKSYAYAKRGNPAKLRAPTKAGSYEVRYVNSSERSVMARQPLTVKPSAVKLETVEGIPAGYSFEVKWTGPGVNNDYITVSTPETKSGQHKAYNYTKRGNPLTLRAPSQPGTYEVRYINGNDRGTLARVQLEVGPTNSSIEAVETIGAGKTFEAKWVGPGNRNDWVEISRPDQKPGKYVSYVYVRRGNPLEMRAPAEPGTYELRYINGSERSALARRKLIVKSGR